MGERRFATRAGVLARNIEVLRLDGDTRRIVLTQSDGSSVKARTFEAVALDLAAVRRA